MHDVPEDSGHNREIQVIGLVLGAVAAPAIAHLAIWSGIGAPDWRVVLPALVFGGLVGRYTLPVLLPSGDGVPGVLFGGMFAGSVGLLAGAFAAFPLGGVAGFLCGGVAGAWVMLLWPRLGSLGMPWRVCAAMFSGMLVSLVLSVVWVS